MLFIIIISMMTSCNSHKSVSPDQWSDSALNDWIDKGEWKEGWGAIPDETVDQRTFAEYYFQQPERWKKAFQFLKEQNLMELPAGRYELNGTNLFVNVDEYISKDEADARFEAHRKYADIQFVVSGEERIGVVPLNETKSLIPYDNDKDIMFLESEFNHYRVANSERFFIFFPEDAHRPGVKMGENSNVRKIVVKVRIMDES